VDYLQKLNPSQRQAAEHFLGPCLVLAGAGSGKTGVLTHRMANLMHTHRVHPSQIFAVTFTNKAAAEMRGRVFRLLQGHPALQHHQERELWVSTFHSSCVRILRSDIHHLGYQNQFTIYDDSDQRSVVKACLKEFNFSENAFSPKAIQARINRLKNDGIDSASYRPEFGGPFEEGFQRVYERYTQVLKKSSALDFADLILQTTKLFEHHPRILEGYQDRFPFLLIDEYQDTNKCQYQLMRLLAARDKNIFAVGDEDQSIYGWRGADISNILNYEKDFPNAKIFKLEQNYRSTKTIIEAASQVISYNTERHDKRLWTENPEGEKISLLECYDEHDEALKSISEIHQRLTQEYSLDQIAIFYRTNAQSRLLEDMLRAKGIAYQIFGGLKFYDRLEVKDTLAYLKLIVNPEDDVSFRRIINVPARGIGAVSLEKLSALARQYGTSLYGLLDSAFGKNRSIELDLGRSTKAFKQFFGLVEALRFSRATLLPCDLVSAVLEETGYRKMLTDENTVESQSRLENLAELRQSVVEFELRSAANDPKKALLIEDFLAEIALVSDLDRMDPNAPSIRMMTIHMAKGLEFDAVLIVGMEEELFPNVRPWEPEEPADIEEERRLFYVAMTRARQKLYLLYSKNRTVFGNSHFRVMSRFIEEIPAEYLEERKADYFSRRPRFRERPGLPGAPHASPWASPVTAEETDSDVSQTWMGDAYQSTSDEFSQIAPDLDDGNSVEGAPGQGSKVLHPLFGEGVVRQTVGRDKLLVEFPGRGVKKISLRFTNLKVL
jgi:DNA helicase II / ATP-dependent DNA helicase PcrA